MLGKVVVIGYGSSLRGDDVVGPRVAESIAARALPGVVAFAVGQLTPELAEPLATCRLALFVDACPGVDSVRVEPVTSSDRAFTPGHSGGPGSLLALARDAFGSAPVAWLVSVPAPDLGLGDRLSPAAARGLEDALARIGRILDGDDAGKVPDA